MTNAWLDEVQAGIKISGRNVNNLTYSDDTTFKAESKEELESVLKKVNEEREKARLKYKQGEKTAFWMGENNSKWSNWQTTNLKNIQATYVAQFQKNKPPNQKMGQRTK